MKEYGKQILVSVIAAIFVFGVGYALLNDTITVSGTATTTGTLDIVVTDALFTSSTGGGIEGDQTIQNDTSADTVTLTVPKLAYPGASVSFTINLRNDGTINGKLIAINKTGGADLEHSTDLAVTYSGLSVNDIIAANGGTDSVVVTVTWLSTSTTGFKSEPFEIEFVFQQSI